MSKNPADRYTKIAEVWDSYIGWERRWEEEGKFLEHAIGTYYFRKDVLDLGCGTGFSAIVVAKEFPLTKQVYGFDKSKSMLNRALENAKIHNVNLSLSQGDWRKGDLLKTYQRGQLDIVMITGNTISLVTDNKSREQLFGQIAQILKPSGYLLLDHLNYQTPSIETRSMWDHVYTGSGFLRYVSREKGKTFVSIYDAYSRKLFYRDEVFPWTVDEMAAELNEWGFVHGEVYVDYNPYGFMTHNGYLQFRGNENLQPETFQFLVTRGLADFSGNLPTKEDIKKLKELLG